MTTINSNAGSYDPLNSSSFPLDVSSSFMGSYTSCLNYSEIDISLYCDSKYTLAIYYSSDSFNDNYIDFVDITSILSETQFYKFAPKMRYFKLELQNTDTIPQTVLIMQCLLKSSFVYEPTIAPVTPVDISGTVLTNNTRNTVTLHSGSSVPAGNYTNIADLSGSVVNILTFYGTCSVPTTLTVMFSHNGSTWYESQYSYIVSVANFGFSLASNPRYLTLRSSVTSYITAYLDYS